MYAGNIRLRVTKVIHNRLNGLKSSRKEGSNLNNRDLSRGWEVVKYCYENETDNKKEENSSERFKV